MSLIPANDIIYKILFSKNKKNKNNLLTRWDMSLIQANDIILNFYMPNEWRTTKALVHKTRLHGRRGKGMAESFNELDVPHGWEEITHTHTCTSGTSNCAMIHAQYEYKSGKDRYIPRAGHARISLNTVHEAQAQYTLCNGTTTVRVKTRANRYTARAGHAKPLYKGYTHSTHCAIVHTLYEYKKTG